MSREISALIERLSCEEIRNERWSQAESKVPVIQHSSPPTSNIMLLFNDRSFDNMDETHAVPV